MKKLFYFWTVIFLLLASTGVQAQLLIGLKGGLQVSKVIFHDKENLDSYKSKEILGFNGGFAVTLKVKDNFYLYSELAYAQKGKKIKGKIDQLLKHKAVYNHIELPLLFRLTFNAKYKKSKDFTWYVNTGPNLSYWLNGRGKLQSSELLLENDVDQIDYSLTFNKKETNDNTVDIQQANRLQLGLIFGGGLVFQPDPNKIVVVDARLELGHTFAGGENSVEFPYFLFDYKDDLRAVNAGLRFSVAYLFDVKIKQGHKGKSTIHIKKRKNK